MAAQTGGSGRTNGSAPSDADLARRLDRLGDAIDAERQERVAAKAPARSDMSGYGQAFKLGSEFVAGVLVGAALGWGLDKVAGTSPWGLIVLLLLGFAAGVLNVVRATSRTGAAATKHRGEEGRGL
jgi:ATP synthase protein I